MSSGTKFKVEQTLLLEQSTRAVAMNSAYSTIDFMALTHSKNVVRMLTFLTVALVGVGFCLSVNIHNF
jgi:hypothetical protein